VHPYFLFESLGSFFMIAGIGFFRMNRAKTYKDETDESELPALVLGVVCVLIALILLWVYFAWT
jgi:hypothetical protein